LRIVLERFDDDEDGRVVNNNAYGGQNQVPLDEVIGRSRLKLDFETAALKIMMSRYFRNRTRFKMAVRFVITQVREKQY
jgi:hypothetical protein